MENVKEYLASIVGLVVSMNRAHGMLYHCMEDFFMQHGRHFMPTDRTFTTLSEFKGKKKACFANTQRYLFNHIANGADEWMYAEGYAVGHKVPLPLYHSWLVNKYTMAAVDLTWDKGVEYFGVVFPTEFIFSNISRTECYAPIIDDWEAGFPFLRGEYKYCWSPDSLGLDSVRILKKIAELKKGGEVS